jgi:hypothetical protein
MINSDEVINPKPYSEELIFWIHFCSHYLEKYEKLPDKRGLLALSNAAAAYIYQEDNS